MKLSVSEFTKAYTKSFMAGTLRALPFFVLCALLCSLGFSAAHAQAVANPDSASDVAQNIVASSAELPGILSAISYLLGVLFGVWGIIKIKDHVESPQQNPARNGYIRLLAGGAFFALPIIYETMFNTISGGGPATPLEQLQPKLNEISGVLGAGGNLGGTTNTVSGLAENIVKSSEGLPGIISAACYILGILLGVLGIIKIKDHVENPTQTPLRTGIIRLLAGGALFAIPIIYNAVFTTISGGSNSHAPGEGTNILAGVGAVIAGLNSLTGFSGILRNITSSINDVPGIISAAAYLLGLVLAVAAVIKAKDHVENPEQTPLRDCVIRFLIAGALFALPSIFNAALVSVSGSTGRVNSMSTVYGIFMTTLFTTAEPYEAEGCTVLGLGGSNTVGKILCTITSSTGLLPAFLTGISYVIGLVFAFWGIMKVKAHVQNPQQTSLWEPVSRLIAGGAFFALPFVIDVVRSTIAPTLASFGSASTSATVQGFNYGSGAGPAGGLDSLLVNFMDDVRGPLYVAVTFFSMLAGTIFIMIGISRLIKTAQDGPRGPGGLGTMMTFVTGAALLSFQRIINAFSTSGFGSSRTKAYAEIQYQEGMTQAEVDAAHATITGILQFVIIVGLISVVRGIFIIRSVGEGNSQASIMSGITHILAGTFAVNLGPLLNAVQETLGLTQFGITFS